VKKKKKYNLCNWCNHYKTFFYITDPAANKSWSGCLKARFIQTRLVFAVMTEAYHYLNQESLT
jgi:hypothetical protein